MKRPADTTARHVPGEHVVWWRDGAPVFARVVAQPHSPPGGTRGRGCAVVTLVTLDVCGVRCEARAEDVYAPDDVARGG